MPDSSVSRFGDSFDDREVDVRYGDEAMAHRAMNGGRSACHQPTCHRDATCTVVDRRGDEFLCCEWHAVLKRAGWACEAVVPDRLHPGEFRRCGVVGSEIEAVNGGARCPRHREVLDA